MLALTALIALVNTDELRCEAFTDVVGGERKTNAAHLELSAPTIGAIFSGLDVNIVRSEATNSA